MAIDRKRLWAVWAEAAAKGSAGSRGHAHPDVVAGDAARTADALLAEFDRRFPGQAPHLPPRAGPCWWKVAAAVAVALFAAADAIAVVAVLRAP